MSDSFAPSVRLPLTKNRGTASIATSAQTAACTMRTNALLSYRRRSEAAGPGCGSMSVADQPCEISHGTGSCLNAVWSLCELAPTASERGAERESEVGISDGEEAWAAGIVPPCRRTGRAAILAGVRATLPDERPTDR